MAVGGIRFINFVDSDTPTALYTIQGHRDYKVNPGYDRFVFGLIIGSGEIQTYGMLYNFSGRSFKL